MLKVEFSEVRRPEGIVAVDFIWIITFGERQSLRVEISEF
jgi:hypothetical protein